MIGTLCLSNLYAQQVKIETGKSTLFVDEFFTISISIQNGKLDSYENFPDIEGFAKDKIESNASSDPKIIVKPLIITQKYFPEKEGNYILPDFSLKVNGKLFLGKGKTITVLAKEIEKQTVIEKNNFIIKPDLLPTKEATLVYATSKKEVYEREQLYITLLVLVPDNSKTILKFNDLQNQLQEIIKKTKPQNCTQETIPLDSIAKGTYTFQNKTYTYFKIYETVLFPINGKEILLPSQNISMQNVKKNEDIKLISKSLGIPIKKIPPHPLKDKVPVGELNLVEAVSMSDFKTGRGFTYLFKIEGSGNLTQIEKIKVLQNPYFEIYEPEVSRKQSLHQNKVNGSVMFTFFMVPEEPGNYGFRDVFSLIYFNPSIGKYDTLHSRFIAQVKGESKKHLGLSLSSDNEYYKLMKEENNFFVNKNSEELYLLLGKVIILIMLILLGVLMIKL